MVRSTARNTARRAAALAAAGTLAVLCTAGPALAASAPAPRAAVAAAAKADTASAPAPAAQTDPQYAQDGQNPQTDPPRWCHHREGLLSALLEGVGDLLGALL
jgi:hypothetical protein